MILFVILAVITIVCILIAYTIGVDQGAKKYLNLLHDNFLNGRHSGLDVQLRQVRRILDKIFAPETQSKGTHSHIPSAGHCAITALLLQSKFQGQLVSAKVQGVSHWYNNLDGIYVDLTGDQFGFPKVQISDREIYPDTKVRNLAEITPETFLRYSIFKDKFESVNATLQKD